ncbi:hypothetical protein [Tellurirhabdus rosea]|uniref:hypothetical protein n=1 Tax=Tellurirhabdus rosea TaxID=2674997 RepID=UPI00225859FD|nr:hypothetical protein [Tellurirhabdus rosea]
MKVSQNPTFKLYEEKIKELEALVKNEQDAAKVMEWKSKFSELKSAPDAFNKTFVPRGWVAAEYFNYNILKKAVDVARTKDIITAEEFLINYYDQKGIETGLRFLWSVKWFKDRLHLIKLAYEDYRNGRYHACVPVVLMMVDGVVSDAAKGFGFFSEKSDLKAWDSIVGADSGLSMLKEILYKTRSVTQKGKITLPYRNGIMHGRDLGYANIDVAVKCWALLFAVRDLLASKYSEQSRKQQYEIEKSKTVDDAIKEWKSLEDSLEEVLSMDSFKRKPLQIGIDIPSFGKPEDYKLNTPERTLVEFIFAWKEGNYGEMAKLLYLPFNKTQKQMAGALNKSFKGKKLIDFSFTNVEDVSSCTVDITIDASILYSPDSQSLYSLTFRLLYCKVDSNDLVVNPAKEGRWKVVNNFHDIYSIGTIMEYIDE